MVSKALRIFVLFAVASLSVAPAHRRRVPPIAAPHNSRNIGPTRASGDNEAVQRAAAPSIPYDPCFGNPCGYDAICKVSPTQERAVCSCPPGYTGDPTRSCTRLTRESTESRKEPIRSIAVVSKEKVYVQTHKSDEAGVALWLTQRSHNYPVYRQALSGTHHMITGLQPDTEYEAQVYKTFANGSSIPNGRSESICTDPAENSKWVDTSLGKRFLEQMRRHFAKSTDCLILSFRMKGKAYERPGLANTLREESDRKWALGLDLTQKYFQRGGRFNNYLKDEYKIQMSLANSQHQDPLGRNDHYLSLVQQLKSNSDKSSRAVDDLSKHKSATYDSDISHYLQEVGEKERSSLRKHTVMVKNMENLIKNGMAMSIFDKSL